MTPDTIKVGPYLTAERLPCAPHDVYTICARDHSTLAHVEWYAPWSRYVLTLVESDAVFPSDCLAALAGFVGGLR